MNRFYLIGEPFVPTERLYSVIDLAVVGETSRLAVFQWRNRGFIHPVAMKGHKIYFDESAADYARAMAAKRKRTHPKTDEGE